MVRSLASRTAILLFANTVVNGRSLDGRQTAPQLTNNGAGADPGRRTKLVEYNYEACPQVPTLHCRHGSTCTPGIASFGKKHEHLDLQTHESGYHCVCPAGYLGHECEIEVDYCDENPRDPLDTCYHGATCQASASGRFFCDCDVANAERGPTEAKFAGAMCQHASTSLCAVSLVGSTAPNHQFCTNHGTCLRLVSGGEPHPGCQCAEGWSGAHCELRRDPFAKVSWEEESWEEESQSNVSGGTLAALLITAGVLLACFVGVFLDVKKKKAADINKGVLFKQPKFTLDDRDEALVEGGASLPALGRHRSVSDVSSEHELDGKAVAASGVESEAKDEEVDGYLPETELV